MADRGVYRALLLLYPKPFRDRYRDDLAQAHDDLIADLGPTRAWCRSGLDLLVTVPRYRLEAIVSTRHSDSTPNVITGTLLVIAAAATLNGGAPLGVMALAVFAVIALTQRSRLARSLRVQRGNQRRRRLLTSAALAGVCVTTLVAFVIDVGGDESWGARAFIYVNIFNVALAAAIVYLVAGLLTHRSGTDAEIAPAVNR